LLHKRSGEEIAPENIPVCFVMALCSVVETEEATFTRLHGVTFQKTDIFTVTAMRISKLKKIVFLIDVNIYEIFLGCKN